MKGTLSLWGLYQADETILDNIQLPEGVDGDLVKSSILFDCAELEILYPDPAFLKMLVGVWSTKELPVWTRINNAINLEYNPIENYDRQESWTEDETGNRSVNRSSSGQSESTADDEIKRYVYGFNTGGDVQQSRDKIDNTDTVQTSGQESGAESNTVGREHSGRIHGNIGVTTSQQMLQSELDIAPKLNIVQYITDSFKQRFCLLVY